MMKTRTGYFAIFLLLVLLAFVSRIALGCLFLPDLLTAAFVFIFFRMLFIHAAGWRIAVLAFGICLLVELSQLYSGPLIDRLRDTLPGRFVLGHQFDVLDILAFSLGSLLAWYGDKKIGGC